MSLTYYPTSPVQVPKKLTALTSSYQLKAFLAVLAIILFFVLYTAMVVGLGYLFYYSIIYDMGVVNKLTILMKVGAIAGAGMLFIFTLKFIFKLKNHKPNNRIKLEKAKNPDLWSFVEQICKETGAPRPKSIYVDPDVNAYVAYSNVWLSLFLPVRKELTIGMGLTDCLNLSEFKAVMSHEFGHFAQRSMKIGSYIISANTIIHDMIFERDKWDDLLDQWRASDIRLSAAAWVITPIIWIVRQMLNLFYQFLNIMHSSLSREMEFNADKVAVHTSGSDAIISALWKLDGGSTAWMGTLNHGILAGRKNIFVKNLYVHNALSIERSSDTQNDLFSALPADPRGGKKYFSISEHSKVGMYASHPPNNMREDSAKVPYVACEMDTRSPWILFGNKEALQEEMTQLLYQLYLEKKPTEQSDIEVFEQFIKLETQGADLAKEYENTFLNRYLVIPSKEKLTTAISNQTKPNKKLLGSLKAELKQLMEPVGEIEGLLVKAQQIAEGTTKERSFSFKGIEYSKKNLENGYNFLITSREELFNTAFEEWDTKFCAFFTALAKEQGKGKELNELYTQHQLLSEFYRNTTTNKNEIYNAVIELQSKGEVTKEQLHSLTARVKDSFKKLNEALAEMDNASFVKMPNVETIQELKEALVDNGEFKIEHGLIFENGGFQKMMEQLENTIYNCQRIDQKSIGCILLFHKDLEPI
ncbi:M48 family metalloprotease [Flagellimonas sp.]|uniref:M48 family metalloprotease n=1 Tax=Flagellimonas sp. TaxID=2058762 RepID=UPI003B5C993F